MSGKSRLLYELMLRKGYPEEFSRLICAEMSTDFTAEKMMSYVSGPKKRLEDVADEMVAIQDHNCVIISESGYNTGYKRGLPVRGTACGGFLTWTALFLLGISTFVCF